MKEWIEIAVLCLIGVVEFIFFTAFIALCAVTIGALLGPMAFAAYLVFTFLWHLFLGS